MANTPPNVRGLKDTGLSANVALPNAANVVNTPAIDLSAQPYPVTDGLTVKIETSASTAANSKNLNVALQSSTDNSSWSNVAEFANPVLLVAGSASAHAASSITLKLQPNTKRYIRAQCTGEANGGDASDGTLTISLLF